MQDKKVWLITGAGRGLGSFIAKAVMAAGDQVVATGRNPEKVKQTLGEHADLLVVKLDITNAEDAVWAVQAAQERFGRIDVLVNNAAGFHAGFFEELSMEDLEQELATNLIGPMKVTRAVLPLMRQQGSGQIISISSTAGLVGFPFNSAYCLSKFGLEGWMEALQGEIEPFGLQTMTVNPGFFRTELLSDESTNYASSVINDYTDRREQNSQFYKDKHGKQEGDPAKLAQALIELSALPKLPRRFIAGIDAISITEKQVADRQQEMAAYRDLSMSLDFDTDPLSKVIS